MLSFHFILVTDEDERGSQTRTRGGHRRGREGVTDEDERGYSRIENGHVEPAVSTLEKLSKVFEVSITEFFKSNNMDEDINLPLLEKIKLIDTLYPYGGLPLFLN
jgi:transcriptional regulator with XRE-family HTH domain